MGKTHDYSTGVQTAFRNSGPCLPFGLVNKLTYQLFSRNFNRLLSMKIQSI